MKKPVGMGHKANSPWRDEFYVKVFRLGQMKTPIKGIAAAIGVTLDTLNCWLKEKPALRRALDESRKGIKGEEEGKFCEYVYNRLPSELKEMWDLLHKGEKVAKGKRRTLTSEEVNDLFTRKGGKYARMHLYVYALIHHSFNASEACRVVNISRKVVEVWGVNEPRFKELLKEIHWHKKNFLESSLMELIASGDSAATIFANRTMNRDRGYNDKVEFSVNGSITHKLKVEDLGLPVDTQRVLLEALRKRSSPAALEDHSKDREVVDAEYQVKEKVEA